LYDGIDAQTPTAILAPQVNHPGSGRSRHIRPARGRPVARPTGDAAPFEHDLDNSQDGFIGNKGPVPIATCAPTVGVSGACVSRDRSAAAVGTQIAVKVI
jgi:hypothetical protein